LSYALQKQQHSHTAQQNATQPSQPNSSASNTKSANPSTTASSPRRPQFPSTT
jgi:hypothetical protein